jgi:hypothetical protein
VCQAIAPLPGGGAEPGQWNREGRIARVVAAAGTALNTALTSGRASPSYAGLFGFEPFESGGAT